MPDQRVIVPKKVIVSSTAVLQDSKILLLMFSIFPEKQLYMYEIIIKIGQRIFNILTP
ncbi:MAG: hypothetical protein HFJ54_02675 [Clostridia bacterium]|nr:hypothetical protein [Clostridia bacterium]